MVGTVKIPFSDRNVTLCRVGNIVTANGYITLTSDFTSVYQNVNETMPQGFCPKGNLGGILRGSDNAGSSTFFLWIDKNGKMTLHGTGSKNRFVGISGTWVAE